jgi:hypothetical protein
VSAFVRKPARSITFVDGTTGRTVAKLRITETGGRGNKHFNPRRSGPTCNQPLKTGGCCGEAWTPVCPNRDCPGNYEVRQVMRIEKYGRKKHERRPA